MIELKNITKTYNQATEKVTAVKDVSLTIGNNEFFGLVGESGSGKSTLLKMINLLEEPTTGEVVIDSQNLNQLTSQNKRKHIKQTAMVFQHFNLLQNLTVAKNIELALKLHGKNKQDLVAEVLAFVGLSNYQNKYPNQLSGGQKQRVAIARAVATQPQILLCDEPTSALDAQNSFEVMVLLKKIQQELGTTIIFVSHELPLIKQWCDKAAIMEKGQLLEVVNVTSSEAMQLDKSYYQQVIDYLI